MTFKSHSSRRRLLPFFFGFFRATLTISDCVKLQLNKFGCLGGL